MCQCPLGLWRKGETYGIDTTQQNADLERPSGSTRESNVLRSGKRDFVCLMSLCPCLTGGISVLIGSKVLGFEKKKKLLSAPRLGKMTEETTKVRFL